MKRVQLGFGLVVGSVFLGGVFQGSVALAQKPRTEETEVPAAAEADAPASTVAEDEKVAGAQAFLEETMGLVEKAKWKEFKARMHPAAVKAMEERKKRTKRDDHNLAFWNHVKEWKIEKWEVTSVSPGARSTAVVVTKEDHFMVEEKGHEEGLAAEWLLVKGAIDGKKSSWWLLDRRNGTGNFDGTAIEKGFGDVLPEEAASPEAAPTTPVGIYKKKMEDLIRAKVQLPEGIPDNQLKTMKVSIKIILEDGGKVGSRVVTRASGNPDFDRAFIRAVEAAAPFPTPKGAELLKAASEGIEVSFKGRP